MPLAISLARVALARVNVLLPLYAHPTVDVVDWDATVAAINAHKDLTFYLVINPANGPTNKSDQWFQLDPGYNTDWVAGVARLNNLSNAVTIGYVSTDYNNKTKKTTPQIQADIDDWASWVTQKDTSGADRNISIHGIWFDETSGISTNFDFYKGLTSYAKNAFKSSTSYMSVLNVGVRMTADYEKQLFALADVVVTRETCWQDETDINNSECPHSLYTPFDAYKLEDTKTGGLPLNKELYPKAAVIVHYVQPPRPVDASVLADQIRKTVSYGIHSTYFTSAKLWEHPDAAPAKVGLVAQLIADAQKPNATLS